MSHKKKSYNKMYTQDEPQIIPEVENGGAINKPIPDEISVPKPEPEPVFMSGTVAECTLLNVREHPDTSARIICMLTAGSEVKVDVDNKYDDWFHVITVAGQEGYCMKRFISIN